MGDFIVFAVIVIALFGGVFWYYKKNRKPEPESEEGRPAPMAKLQTKIANMEARGMKQGNDFEIFIVSESEYKRKSDEVEQWMLSRFEDKTGKFSGYSVDGRGLSEFQYVTEDKVYDVFLLIVDKTAEDIIPEPEPTTDIIEVEGLEVSTGEQIEKDYTNTRILREQFKDDDKIYVLPKGEFYAYGILPEDPADRSYIDDDGERKHIITGERGGTVRIKNVSKVGVIGSGDNETTLFTVKPLVDQYYPNPTNRRILSKRKFIEFINSQYSFVYNMGVKSNNVDTNYIYPFEFEHAIEGAHSDFIHIEKFRAKDIWGDGIYLSNCNNVYVKDVIIDGNGRQGGAMISGNRIYLEDFNVLDTPRGGFDIEGNTSDNDTEDVIITYSNFVHELIGLPMGGRGNVRNVLTIYNRYSRDPIISNGSPTKKRENIMFVRCKAKEFGKFEYTNGILIDGIEQVELHHNEVRMLYLSNCTDITIRNCDMPTWGRLGKSNEPFFYVKCNGTPLSEFKIYNNKQKIAVLNTDDETLDFSQVEKDKWYHVKEGGWEIARDAFEETHGGGDMVRNPKEDFVLGEDEVLKLIPFHFPEYTPTEEEAKSIPFEVSSWMQMQWDRLYTNGHGWREENYVDDGWRPDWVKENYKKIGF